MLSLSTLHIARVISPVFPGLGSQPFTLGTAWLLALLLLSTVVARYLSLHRAALLTGQLLTWKKFIFTSIFPQHSEIFQHSQTPASCLYHRKGANKHPSRPSLATSAMAS
jgi:hypothetical protein